MDQLDLSGHFSQSGNIAIAGICSHHTAIGLLWQEVVKDFVAPTKQYFADRRFGLLIHGWQHFNCHPNFTEHPNPLPVRAFTIAVNLVQRQPRNAFIINMIGKRAIEVCF